MAGCFFADVFVGLSSSFEQCFEVWFSAPVIYHKLMDSVVSCAHFLTGGCLAHRPSSICGSIRYVCC